jgi:hypothetical protein
MLGKIECPGEPAGTKARFMVLITSHHHQKSQFKSLAMRAGLISITRLACTSHIQMPRMECGIAVGDFHNASSPMRLEMNVSKPFFWL